MTKTPSHTPVSVSDDRAARIDLYFDICRDFYSKGHRLWCFAAVVPKADVDFKGQLGVVEYGVGGFIPLAVFFQEFSEADHCSDQLNKRLGMDMNESLRIVSDSLRRAPGSSSPAGVMEKSAVEILERLLDFLDESEIHVHEVKRQAYAGKLRIGQIEQQIATNAFINTIKDARAVVNLTRKVAAFGGLSVVVPRS